VTKSRKTVPFPLGTDLKDPDLYQGDEFRGVFSRLRAEDPVCWNPEVDSAGFWAVTKYADLETILRDAERFSPAAELGGMRIFNIQDVNGPDAKPHLLSLGPPAHGDLRRAILPAFSSECVARMEPGIRSRMTELVDKVAPTGQMEVVSAIAAPLTVGTLADLMNVPRNDEPRLLRWSDALIGDDDSEQSQDVRARCVTEIDDYAAQIFRERRNSPRADLLSLLANATVDGKPIDGESFSTNLAMLIVAGSETTRHAITAGLLALMEAPNELAKITADPSLFDGAVKEILRWATPLMHVRRTATRDVWLGHHLIKKGDKVVVWYASANRDEEKWVDPERFDLCRFSDKSVSPHFAFGAGPHHCLGWRLAELQVKIALQEMLLRLPNLRLSTPVRRLRSNFVYGIKEMFITFTARAAAGQSVSAEGRE
jgi:linalool 8-monooxygenase